LKRQAEVNQESFTERKCKKSGGLSELTAPLEGGKQHKRDPRRKNLGVRHRTLAGAVDLAHGEERRRMLKKKLRNRKFKKKGLPCLITPDGGRGTENAGAGGGEGDDEKRDLN